MPARILVVDDDIGYLTVTKDLLERCGHEVLSREHVRRGAPRAARRLAGSTHCRCAPRCVQRLAADSHRRSPHPDDRRQRFRRCGAAGGREGVRRGILVKPVTAASLLDLIDQKLARSSPSAIRKHTDSGQPPLVSFGSVSGGTDMSSRGFGSSVRTVGCAAGGRSPPAPWFVPVSPCLSRQTPQIDASAWPSPVQDEDRGERFGTRDSGLGIEEFTARDGRLHWMLAASEPKSGNWKLVTAIALLAAIGAGSPA